MVGVSDPGILNRLLNSITTNRSGLKNSLAKIASGQRLGRAGEDPTGKAISEQLKSDIRALSQAAKNVEQGSNFIQTAEGGLSSITDLLQRGRELAIQAASGTIGDTERATLNQEFTAVKSEIDRISASLEFNGQPLLDGSLASGSPTQIDIQVGLGSTPSDRININVVESTNTQALAIDNADISTAANAIQAFQQLDSAQSQVISSRGAVGAVGNRLAITGNGIRTTVENLIRSEDQISSTDLAEEISNLKNTLLRVETSIRSLVIQNRQAGNFVGRLLDTSG